MVDKLTINRTPDNSLTKKFVSILKTKNFVKQNDNNTDRIASAYLRHSPFKPSNPADLPLSRLCTRDNTLSTETTIP